MSGGVGTGDALGVTMDDRERRVWLRRYWLRRFRRLDRLEVFVLQNVPHGHIIQLAVLLRSAQPLNTLDVRLITDTGQMNHFILIMWFQKRNLGGNG